MSNDGWGWQGRQYHQWFGNGTKPKDDLFAPDAAGERLAYVANTIISNLPRAARGHASAVPDGGAREQLRRAMTAWYGARALSRDAFRQRFLDATTSTPSSMACATPPAARSRRPPSRRLVPPAASLPAPCSRLVWTDGRVIWPLRRTARGLPMGPSASRIRWHRLQHRILQRTRL